MSLNVDITLLFCDVYCDGLIRDTLILNYVYPMRNHPIPHPSGERWMSETIVVINIFNADVCTDNFGNLVLHASSYYYPSSGLLPVLKKNVNVLVASTRSAL